MEVVTELLKALIGFVLFFFWWIVLALSMHKDRSRYRNIIFLFLAILSTFPLVVSPVAELASLVIILLLLITPFMLIANGIIMMKKEGRSLANLLSLLLGVIVLLGEWSVVALGPLASVEPPQVLAGLYAHIPALMLMFSISVVYGSLVFVAFMFYSVFLQIIPAKKNFNYIIIHGSGLIDGDRVSKLLSDRLDKAIELYHKDPMKPIMIPSGGKGSDETVAEGVAMAAYLEQHGIPKDHILIEDASVNTLENLKNSKALIDARPGEHYTALVTSNYHVYRALRYCRRIGFSCTGVGARVAPYYWPSALIREFVAVHREKKHLIAFIVGWLIIISPFVVLALFG